ncbi:hypothetical protein ATANTOWER_002870 [Ataeniobius toweri]|uniref:Uncharacterized protein n=1 Tax=Ataeniobius toweri TaxID=208326 RepID=A0ABU7C762_9TELE|nr:hypothetical protein [Ataeniobius toweri]
MFIPDSEMTDFILNTVWVLINSLCSVWPPEPVAFFFRIRIRISFIAKFVHTNKEFDSGTLCSFVLFLHFCLLFLLLVYLEVDAGSVSQGEIYLSAQCISDLLSSWTPAGPSAFCYL